MAEFNEFNIRGRVTYSNFTMAQAIAANSNPLLQYPKAADKVAPDFQLLLTQPQVEKFTAWILETYVPECLARGKAGEKRNAFDQKMADKIKRAIDAGVSGGPEAWDAPPHLPLKNVYAKTLDVVPDAWATLKVSGSAGRDLELLAKVSSEEEFRTPPANEKVYPLLAPLTDTVHDLYPGSVGYSTLRLASFQASSSVYGVSAYANQLVFIRDDERIGGGGGGIDTDGVFMDDDED